MNNIKFSIIVPFQYYSKNIDLLLDSIQKNKTKNIKEVIFICDENINIKSKKYNFSIKIIISNALPSEKRNLGVNEACGNYLIFIDDDAFPNEQWIMNIENSINKNYEIVGGPGILPKKHNFFQKLVYIILISKFFTFVSNRYFPEKIKIVNEWPSMNFIIKKKLFIEIGGFDNRYWPGEDSELCLKLNNLGKSIYYNPNIIVFHNPRSNIYSYTRQIFRYGLHRARLLVNNFKIRDLFYLFPLLNIIALLLIILFFQYFMIFIALFYAFIIFIAITEIKIKSKYSFIFIIPALLIVPLNHLTYSIGIIIGCFIPKKAFSKKGR